MNGKERMLAMLSRKPQDCIPAAEAFWTDTLHRWTMEGHLAPGEDWTRHFNLDARQTFVLNTVVDLDHVPQVLEETEDTIVRRDGNGAILRFHKQHDSTPEHIGFAVKDRATWGEFAKSRLTFTPRRINKDAYAADMKSARELGQCLCFSGSAGFECITSLCGHQYLLLGMCDDPEWVSEMMDTYVDLMIAQMEDLFSAADYPDAFWVGDDLGFKGRPFMSPTMYRELIMPAHKRLFTYMHSTGRKVALHSCGYVEPLISSFIEAGVDCLEAIEVKAGMDLIKLYHTFGDRLSFIGGMDVMALGSNDRGRILRELETKIPVIKQGFGYCLHSDHSIPSTMDYDNYRFFLEEGRRLGR